MIRYNSKYITYIACLLALAGVAILHWPKGKLDLGLYHAQKTYDLGVGKPGDLLKSSVRLWNLQMKPVTIEANACCGSKVEFHGGGKKRTIQPFSSTVVDAGVYVYEERGNMTKPIEFSISRGKEQSFDYLMFQYYSPGKPGS